jgi:hypothetical protein
MRSAADIDDEAQLPYPVPEKTKAVIPGDRRGGRGGLCRCFCAF